MARSDFRHGKPLAALRGPKRTGPIGTILPGDDLEVARDIQRIWWELNRLKKHVDNCGCGGDGSSTPVSSHPGAFGDVIADIADVTAYWPMQDASGNVTDVTSSGHMTPSGSPTYHETGPGGDLPYAVGVRGTLGGTHINAALNTRATYSDGFDCYIEGATYDDGWTVRSAGDPLTVGIWAKPDFVQDTNQPPAGLGWGAGMISQMCYAGGGSGFVFINGYALTLMPDRKVCFAMSGSDGGVSNNYATVTTDAVLPTTEWSFVTATYDGDVATIFINGAAVQAAHLGVVEYGHTGAYPYDNGGEFGYSTYCNDPDDGWLMNSYYQGLLAGGMFSGTVLTDDQILDLYLSLGAA